MRQGKVGNLGELDSGSGAEMTVMQGSLFGRTMGAGDGGAWEEREGLDARPRDSSTPLRCAQNEMLCEGMDSRLRGKTDGEVGLTVKVDGKILASDLSGL